MHDIVVIGAGPAGLTAAIYARRAGKSVLVLEKDTFGGQVTFSPKLENYPGFESISGTKDKCQYRQELTSTGDVITTVGSNPDAIGYASLASVKDTVKALTVGGVAPSEATVKDGSYVVQRPFVLVTKDGTKLSDSAQKFFDYITSDAASQIISKAGAVPVK